MGEPNLRGVRSMLYVPGDRRERLDKAFSRGADALIVDLEDAVAPASKVNARTVVTDWLQRNSARAGSVWLRINSDAPEDDIDAITVPISGVMVPRAEVELVSRVTDLITTREAQLGCEPGRISVIPLIETARGLLSAIDLASMTRVEKLAIGRADLAGELGLSIDPDGPEFLSLLMPLVVASSAAGIAAPVAPTSTDFRDLDALRMTTRHLMKLGFRGRTAVHPAQVAVINEVFTPSQDEVLRAERLVTAFAEAERAGSGIILGDDGRMVDAAVVRSAREILARVRPPEATE